MGKLEIDFVSQRRDEILFVQVATSLTEESTIEESTIEEEFGNLEKIHDTYPKVVLSIDEVPVGGRNGVRCFHIRDWF